MTSKFNTAAAFAITTALSATAGLAQAVIDRELSEGIDFRSVEFRACFDQTECTVNGMTITAQSREEEEAEWVEATIYWDPIDGLGIKDGAQNDEIDFNERLIVKLDTPRALNKVWLSDLFTREDRRYGSSDTDRVEGEPEDAEIAGIGLGIDGAEFANVTVSGEARLPWATFNQEISIFFRENGDLRRRVLINSDDVTLVVPGTNSRGRFVTLSVPVGQIDKDKKSIFSGVETVEIDLTEILAEFNEAPLFPVGTSNFEIIRSLVNDPAGLEKLKRVAENKRTSIRMSNGELGWQFETPQTVDTLTFYTPFDASNDYSVAGVIFE